MAKKELVGVDELIEKLSRCKDSLFGEMLKHCKILSVINTPVGLTIHFSVNGIHNISYWGNDGKFTKSNILVKRMDLEAYIQAQEILDKALMSFK